MADRYSHTTLLFLFALSYCALTPLVLVITLGGIVIQYWTDKYLMMRRFKQPEMMQETMVNLFSKTYPFYMLVYAGGCSYFYTRMSESLTPLSYVNLIIAAAIIILPIYPTIERIADRCCRNKVKPI